MDPLDASPVLSLDPPVGRTAGARTFSAPTATVPAGFFGLRTPLLPFDEWFHWADGAGPVTGGDAAIARAHLRTILSRPEVREAILVASPDLDDAIPSWEQEPRSGRGLSVERALVRYVTRMATRATPFGLFAGHSVGLVGKRTDLVVADRSQYRRRSTVDAGLLSLAWLECHAEDGASVVHRTNPTLWCAAGTVRYVEVSDGDLYGDERSHRLISVPPSQTLTTILGLAERLEGATEASLVEELAVYGLNRDEAHGYIDQLVSRQILVRDLGPTVTGPDPLAQATQRVRPASSSGTVEARRVEAGAVGAAEEAEAAAVEAAAVEAAAVEAAAVEAAAVEAAAVLRAVDEAGLGNASDRYREIGRVLGSLGPPWRSRPRVIVDLLKPAPGATLGQRVVAEVQHAADVLRRLAPGAPQAELDHFKWAFERRYSTRTVPLLEALDAELGIGFGPSREASSLLDGLVLPSLERPPSPWGPRESVLLDHVVRAAASNATSIRLTDTDIAEIESRVAIPAPPLPRTHAVRATLAGGSPESVDGGNFQVAVHAVSGPSGALLFGRLCRVDRRLHDLVRDHLGADEAGDANAVFAEIVYQPAGNDANLVGRPTLRDYEIPVWGRSAVPDDRQIRPSDLLVSLADGQVVLHSARLGHRVVPRLTNAHNYHRSGHPVYRFLGALQSQGTAGGGRVAWDWGNLANLAFLPRVVHRRAVLSPARWLIDGTALAAVGERGRPAVGALAAWRSERRLPRLVELVDSDGRLAIDFDNPLSAETFVHMVHRRREVVLHEFFPGPDELCVWGPEGRFVHELVIPFVATEGPATAAPRAVATTGRVPPGSAQPGEGADVPGSAPAAAPADGVRRRFPPGSEWLYAKLYTAPSIGDRLLTGLVGPLASQGLANGSLDGWFFLRYADPDWHIRVRFHGEGAALHSEVAVALAAAVGTRVDDGQLWRAEFDTYEREVERYGGPDGILVAERLFHIDSEAVVEVLSHLPPGDRGATDRWQVALTGVDQLIGDFGLDPAAKHQLMRRMWAKVATEHGAGADLEAQLSRRFRDQRPELERLTDPSAWPARLSRYAPALQRRSRRLAPLAAELQGLVRSGRLRRPLSDIVAVYAHMFANRLLRSDPRLHELVLYSFLMRLYASAEFRSTR